MIVKGFVEVLAQTLREQRELREQAVLSGVKDWSDYQNSVGVIQGLAIAERELQALAEKAKAQDE